MTVQKPVLSSTSQLDLSRWVLLGAKEELKGHGVEQAFMPAVKLIEKSALAAEVPDPVCPEMKDAPSCTDTPAASARGRALPDSARCNL